MKSIAFIKKNNGSHWVGDGFPVRNIFSYTDIAEEISPFLMMDYAGPVEFEPTPERRGVGEHPHRGFETVTIVYSGEVEHRDSSGAGGTIGPGDVQWMTAASGVVHEEFHGREFARKGGRFEMIQLWVNLPKKYKMSSPRYQAILNEQIPEIPLEKNQGIVRVIAGAFQGIRGPASTFSPMSLWDVRLAGNQRFTFEVPEGQTTAVFVLSGEFKAGEKKKVQEAELAVFEKNGRSVLIETTEDSQLLIMMGEPLNEPIVGYGPFVMNSEEEIRQALTDYRNGKMGRLR